MPLLCSAANCRGAIDTVTAIGPGGKTEALGSPVYEVKDGVLPESVGWAPGTFPMQFKSYPAPLVAKVGAR